MIKHKLGRKVIEQLKNFPAKPSQWLGDKLEALTGLTYDFHEGDWGNGPRGK